MTFASVSYVAVAIAAVAAFVFGALYYGVVSKQWMAAGRIAPEQAGPGPALLGITFVCELVMAFVLALVIGGLGAATLLNGIAIGALLWLGLIMAPMTMNHRYQAYGWDLTVIDGGHWLGAALIMGAIIGWWG